MRLCILAALTVSLSACAGSRLPGPSDTWYVIPPTEGERYSFAAADGLSRAGEPMYPGTRYQITERYKRFYRVRLTSGSETWITANSDHPPVVYSQVAHGSPERLARFVREYRSCAEFVTPSQARVALAAGNTELDGDGDGVPCEDGFAARRRAAPRATPSRSRGNCHWVGGYTRRDGTRVRGHRRCR